MKLSELIERLEELRDELRFVHGDRFDPEILAATQPSYPLAGVIHGAAATEDGAVWIAVNGPPTNRSPYAPREAWGD